MNGTSLPAGDEAIDRVALSVLRVGFDTKACRVFEAVQGRPRREPADGHTGVTASDQPSAEPAGGVVGAASALAGLAGLVEPDRDRCLRLVADARERARRGLAAAAKGGFGFVSILDPDYPGLLRHIADPPLGLWMRSGADRPFTSPAVAIVGSRHASVGGTATARRLARDLASLGITIVSGLARGIDEAAHRGALDAGGATIGVLGSGLDVIYPPEHAALAADVIGRGALLSELPPGTRPLARHFPLRNRIISGLSVAVIVIEASDRSGSLITARMALEQGRDVLAVPGNVVSGCHRGCHALIKDGARLVETVEDVLDQMGWPRPPQPGAGPETRAVGDPLLRWIPSGEPVGLDELARRSRRSAADLLATLARLELAGHVSRSGAGFLRLDGPATNRERE